MKKEILHTLAPVGLLAALAAASGGAVSCGPVPTECEDDATCRASYGATFYCADDGICDQYTASEYLASPCDYETVGPVFEEGTFNVGVILALNRDAEYFGLIEPIAKAIKLAQRDVNTGPGINGTKMGLIFCNTDGKNEQAQAAAEHLTSVGVQAVIGPDFSGYTLEVVPEVLVPNGVVAISPSATAPAISGLDDKDLMWRTVASDRIQANVVGQLIQYVINDVVVPEGDAPRVAMLVRENDAYADGLRQGSIETLPTSLLDDTDRFKVFEYPNSGRDEGDDYSQVSIEVSDFQPDVVIVYGLTEVWELIDSIDRLLEEDHSMQNTIFITADGGKDSVRADEVGSERPGLSGRVWGTAPRSLSAEEYPPYKSFKVRWSSEYATDADTHPFITNAYDAVYLLAFALASAGGDTSGAALAQGLKRLTRDGATEIVANQQEFPEGVRVLSSGGSIDFVGASGPVEFDTNGDPVSTTISLWCLSGNAIAEQGDLLTAGSDAFTSQDCDYQPTPQMMEEGQ